jgi:hypothetical protein
VKRPRPQLLSLRRREHVGVQRRLRDLELTAYKGERSQSAPGGLFKAKYFGKPALKPSGNEMRQLGQPRGPVYP